MKSVKTTPHQRNEYARRKAMGVAVIQRPLRLIAAKTKTSEVVDGRVVCIESHVGMLARYAATRGDGASVKRIARKYI